MDLRVERESSTSEFNRGLRESPLRVCVLDAFSCVPLFVTLWTIARQTPLSMRFSRHKYWSGLPCPPPEDLPREYALCRDIFHSVIGTILCEM